jgi:hypothetical protein
MRANPPNADLYLQWRETDFGRTALPGLRIETEETAREFSSIEAALKHIRTLHNQRLTDDAKGKK